LGVVSYGGAGGQNRTGYARLFRAYGSGALKPSFQELNLRNCLKIVQSIGAILEPLKLGAAGACLKHF